MSTHDKHGRAWATHANTKEGTIIEVDGGFDCIRRGFHKEVKREGGGRLYIECSQGRHYLDGQCDYVDGDAVYIGLYNITEEKKHAKIDLGMRRVGNDLWIKPR